MTAAERRRRIDQATRAARAQAIARREAVAGQVREIYAALAEDIAQWMQANADADGNVPPELLPTLERHVQELLRNAQERWQRALEEGLAALAGFGATVAELGAGSIAAQALEQVRRFVGADGLQLSERIWRVNAATRQRIEDVLRAGIVRGATAREAARALLGEGKGISVEIAQTIRAARAGTLGAQLTDALLTGQGNPLFNAERLLRTEMNRAFTESFVSAAFTHPDVAAVKFKLSPAHPRPDICDLYAAANLHGLGPGVYPQGAHPYPAHPQTLSYLEVVFVDEITPADRAGRQSMSDWLRTQPADVQEQVLGIAKAQAFRAGGVGEADLLRPWREIKPKGTAP